MKKLKMISKKEIKNSTPQKIYDIEVGNEHNYILKNNIISHNSIGSYIPHNEVSGGGGIKYNSSIIMMLTKSKLKDDETDAKIKKRGVNATRVGIVVTVTPIKQRFARPIKVQIHIPFYKKPNPYVGLEKFVSWDACGIIRGKLLSEKDYNKLSVNEQKTCGTMQVEETSKLSKKHYEELSENDKKTKVSEKDGNLYITETVTKYAFPKETARSLVCKHLGGEISLKELYTSKVFTNEVLHQLDENVIKETFMLPSIESLEDLAEVTAELEETDMDDTETEDISEADKLFQ